MRIQNINYNQLKEQFLEEYQNTNINTLLDNNLINLDNYYRYNILQMIHKRVGNGECKSNVIMDIAIDKEINENTIYKWYYNKR